MSTIEKVTDTLDKIKAMISESGEFEGRSRITSAKQLSDMLQRRYDAMPEDDKKTLKKRVNSSLADLKNILKKVGGDSIPCDGLVRFVFFFSAIVLNV